VADQGTTATGCAVALIRAEHGIISPALPEKMTLAAGSRLTVIQLPSAYHHMMIGRPLETISAIRGQLSFSIGFGTDF
jgi:hypothetical protein